MFYGTFPLLAIELASKLTYLSGTLAAHGSEASISASLAPK